MERQDGLELEKGVREACNLSPYLLNLCSEHIMKKSNMNDGGWGSALEEDVSTISGMLMITALLSENKEDLMKLLQKVKKETKKRLKSYQLRK